MNSICIFCGSSDGNDPAYIEGAVAMADTLAEIGCNLVYGGASIGVMGTIADAMLARGREVTGVIPEFLIQHEIGHADLTHLRVVSSMHERKAVMAELSDGFIALPGGIGTLEELMEMATWQQLDQHQKPIGVLNTVGYYDKFFEFLEHAVNQGFLKMPHLDNLLRSSDPAKLLRAMSEFAADPASRQVKKV